MPNASRSAALDAATLGVGIVALATYAPIAVRLGPTRPGVEAWVATGAWIAALLLVGCSVRRGDALGWRQFLAIAPGLLVVGAMPKPGAIAALLLLGALLLAVARKSRVRSVGRPTTH